MPLQEELDKRQDAEDIELQQQMETTVAYAYYAVGKEHGQQEVLAQQANAAAAATEAMAAAAAADKATMSQAGVLAKHE